VTRELAKYTSPEIENLSADGATFISQETANAFENALMANMLVWKQFLEAIAQAGDVNTPERYVTLNADMRQGLERAREADREMYLLIKLDVSWTDYDRKYFRTRRRARRRQLRQFRKLQQQRTDSWGLPYWQRLPPASGQGSDDEG
jgi:hypothetical protein